MSQPEQRTPNSQSPTQRNALLALIANLRAFAFSLTGDSDRADDLVQDTLLKAWEHFDSFREGTLLRAWLFTIQRNTFFSECRHRRHVNKDPDGHKVNALSVQYGYARLSPRSRCRAARTAGSTYARRSRWLLLRRSGCNRRMCHRYHQEPGTSRAMETNGSARDGRTPQIRTRSRAISRQFMADG